MPADPTPGSHRRFAIVTDSTADIPATLAQQRDITVVPMTLTIGEETFSDGALTQQEFFDRMRSAAALPTTSQPSVGELTRAYATALETAESVIALHISSNLSGTCTAAQAAAEQFEGRVHVFDSRNLSWGLGWQVIDAADAADQGLSAPEALARLERTRAQIRQIVSLDSLENLRRGGRIGAVASALGSMLRLKVTIAVQPDGTFAPMGRSRGDAAALNHMLAWIEKQMGDARAGRFAVGHAMAPEKALRLAAAIKQRWEPTELVMYEAGAAISTHAGVIWGTSFWPGE